MSPIISLPSPMGEKLYWSKIQEACKFSLAFDHKISWLLKIKIDQYYTYNQTIQIMYASSHFICSRELLNPPHIWCQNTLNEFMSCNPQEGKEKSCNPSEMQEYNFTFENSCISYCALPKYTTRLLQIGSSSRKPPSVTSKANYSRKMNDHKMSSA